MPFLLVGAVVFAVLQGQLLRSGILAGDWILGSPMLVSRWLFACIGMVALFAKHLGALLAPSPEPANVPAHHVS